MQSFSIASKSTSYPSHPYEDIKNAVLGKKYTATLAFVSPKKAKELNATYRKKTYVPNVLSFPLTPNVGEIYISLSAAKKEAKDHGLSFEGYVGYLFIHGLLHLKGLDHGAAMDRAEARLKKRFTIA